MRPGKRVWLAAVSVMLFLPNSVWKGEPARAGEMRVVVRQPGSARSDHGPQAIVEQQKASKPARARTARKRETPGLKP
jgi:hypothetical protein